MEYRNLVKTMGILAAFSLVCGSTTPARAYPDDRVAFALGWWGAVSGPRECDATNVDGICIAWHSTLKGVSPARWAQCTASGCDLRPDARPARGAPPMHDTTVAQQLMVVQHDICPVLMDAQAKPIKAASHVLPVEGPTDSRAEHGPIVPRVIEVHPPRGAQKE